MGTPRILVIDNYDSFVFNLVQYLAQLGADVTVKRNQNVTLEEAISYDGILISPGPGTPQGCWGMSGNCTGRQWASPDLWSVPRTPSHCRSFWWRDYPRPGTPTRQDITNFTHRKKRDEHAA